MKIADGKNQVNLLSIYIIVTNIPPMITDDIYIKSSNTSAKEIRRQNINIPPKRNDDIYKHFWAC